MKIDRSPGHLLAHRIVDWRGHENDVAYISLMFKCGGYTTWYYLYPDGTLHNNCHEDAVYHGYYPTREDAQWVLQSYLAMNKCDRPTIVVHGPSREERPGSYPIGTFFYGKDGLVVMSTHGGFFGLDGVKVDDEDTLRPMPAGTTITITIPRG